MKNKAILLLVLCLLFISSTAVMADDASELIGTITCYVERIQSYPDLINNALCDHDLDEYRLRMAEMATWIQSANNAMADANLPNTLNLWAVYAAVTANPNCGVHDAALSKADWSREELDRISYRFGLYETGLKIGGQCSMAYISPPETEPEEEEEEEEEECCWCNNHGKHHKKFIKFIHWKNHRNNRHPN